MKNKIFATILSIYCMFNLISLNATDNYDSYELSSSKLNGIKYELSNSKITNDSLYLKGWSYIDNAQNYLNTDDIKTTIGVKGSDGYKAYYPTKISNDYSMTNIEYFENAQHEWCRSTEFNKTADQCNYKYEYVTYEVYIPLLIFKPGVTYEFYIYTNACDEGSKMYTKLYADNLNFNKTIDGITYQGESNLDLTQILFNDEYVIVRQAPGKNSQPFSDKQNKTYYFTSNKIYDYIDTKVIDNVTWFKLKFQTTNEQLSTRYLAVPGNQYSGWVASPYLDFSGNGNFQLQVTSEANASIDAVYAEVLSPSSGNIGVDVTFDNFIASNIGEITMSYNGFIATQVYDTIDGKYHFNFHIDPKYIKAGAKVYINLDGNYYDNQPDDNHFEILPLYPTYDNIKISNSQTIKSISGFKQTRSTKQLYYETITIDYTNKINSIDPSIGDYNAKFNNYYSGGAFEHEIKLIYQNNYPDYSYEYRPQELVIELNDCNHIIDSNEKINYQYIEQKFIIPKLLLTEHGLVINENGKNLLLTKLNLDKGTYTFESEIKNLGVNQLNITLITEVKISGHLIGNSRNNLFYYRPIISSNPMPNYQSSLWALEYNKLDNAINSNQPYHEIIISKAAIEAFQQLIQADYRNNINNESILKEEYDKLIGSGNIKEVQ